MSARRIAIVAALLLAALAGAPPASARHGLTLGFSDDPLLTSDTPAARFSWIPRAVTEGAGIVRVNVPWSQVAPLTRPPGFDPSDPSSPGYDWSAVDAAVRDLSRQHIMPLINTTLAPGWAEGLHRPGSERPGTWRPDPAQFGRFAQAAARRYDGHYPDPLNPGEPLPRVRYWQGWNEPNLDYYLSPQWTRRGRRWTLTAPVLYRRLQNAFYRGVKGVDQSNFVITAGTAPYGDLLGHDRPGSERTPPVAFDRALFCLAGAKRPRPVHCHDPVHLDALSHHPYGIGGPLWHALNADDAAVPDIDKIARVLHAAERAGHVLPQGRKRLWVTEISWDSAPPDPRGVPLRKHARWLEQALYVLWRQGVDTVLWLELADAPCDPDCASSQQAGIYFTNGGPKPAATAYRFPFVTRRLGPSRVQAWGRAPAAGLLSIERRRHGRWDTIRRLRVTARQVFVAGLGVSGRATLRAQTGAQTSLSWTQGGGAG